MDRCFKRCKLCLRFFKVLSLDRKCQVSFLLDSLSAFKDLLLDNIVIDLTEVIESVLGIRDQNIITKHIHILILVIHCDLVIAVQRIKELTVPFKYSDLLIFCGGRIVDILKSVALGISVPCNLKDTILRDRHDLNCFLYGFRTSIKRLTCLLQLLKTILK